MNLQGGNRASSSSTRGCTVIPPPDRVPLLPRGHCETQLYLVIAQRVPLLSLRGAQPRGNLHQGDRHALHPTWCRARDDRRESLRGASSLLSLRGPKGRSNLL